MSDRLTRFLYILLRDHLPSGVVEGLMLEHLEKKVERQGRMVVVSDLAIQFSNPYTEAHARELAFRLMPSPQVDVKIQVDAAQATSELQKLQHFLKDTSGEERCGARLVKEGLTVATCARLHGHFENVNLDLHDRQWHEDRGPFYVRWRI